MADGIQNRNMLKMRNLRAEAPTTVLSQKLHILVVGKQQRRNIIFYAALVAILCPVFYFFGSHISSSFSNNGGGGATVFPAALSSSKCASSAGTKPVVLGFVSRHGADAVLPRAGYEKKKNYSVVVVERGGQEQGVRRFPACDVKLSEYTPCHDVRRRIRFPRGNPIYLHARKERHCPGKKEQQMKCLIPAPYGYKKPFRWPESRDKVWYANVPHKWLTVEKAHQNWVRFEGDRFSFPGGGTTFRAGADAYIDEISKVVNLGDGGVRTAIDMGCGVASWGAYLMSRNILPLSFAPKDTHEAQVQFALERGVPATIGVMATQRLPYPARAFDMAHCARCLIPWAKHDGIYLAEVDRILRPGGYWVLSGPPINWQMHWRGWNRTKDDLQGEQSRIEQIARALCWKKLGQRGDIAVWQKPTNHLRCFKSKKGLFKIKNHHLPFCNTTHHKPDQAWYTNLDTCLTPLPSISTTAGGELPKWPERLNSVPPRIAAGSIDGFTAESFTDDVSNWRKRISHYKTLLQQLNPPQLLSQYRNILDMNAGLGGFAASIANEPVWVMNVVPVEAKADTLGAVFERGLIGTYHSWCEAMSTYPRTYDLLHARSVFALYQGKGKCEVEDILLEMDRILRPEGSVIFVDDVDVLVRVKKVTDGMRWDSSIHHHHHNGPLHREKILVAVKQYWTAPNPAPAPLQTRS